ncbi:copper chaperone PCu(A)C [Corynebacterium uberis]|uniref:copper chaperone PCu(A)C n=1 Tax=Corynebacterium TaxID=1716 RepID=UPI001D09DF8D|nr:MULTISPECIES: copper chaperone PCu(A)C [Corynebacterium]MCZ9308531.1 copper chaperone PCu(A)C [Corynebacterium sp. c6VSa_13]UDL74183.1 copper chaperone PCu(A)C [Corynebacterium uberis]UDL74933.1 copper chaperone PCu(A)C [Corynebacterium uberis]UDL77148.1 copper chaperone PCu(A)C [Corynebacterium uberis]UDL79430.1 copper chaperone PCu(A)C [Corynebacterium uberis]
MSVNVRKGSTALGVLCATVLVGAGLAACSPDEQPSTNTSPAANPTAAAPKTTSNAAGEHNDSMVTFERGVVRAKGTDNDMTAVFGTLVNHTDKDVRITGLTSSLGTATYQLHEVVNGVMQEKPGGFVVPANGTYELAPGADHMMIMGYAHPVASGDTVTLTLTTDAGEVEVPEVPVRVIAAGEENYGDLDHGGADKAGEHGDHGMKGHDMNGHDMKGHDMKDQGEHAEHQH